MFYAAVAIRDRGAEGLALAERPLAVGGALVLTANYVARRWGVRSAMPAFVAKELCRRGPEFGMPTAELTFVAADYGAYREVAQTAMAVYREYDPSAVCTHMHTHRAHTRARTYTHTHTQIFHAMHGHLRPRPHTPFVSCTSHCSTAPYNSPRSAWAW